MEITHMNELELVGRVLKEPTVHHKRQDDVFLTFDIGIPRNSGTVDCIQVLCLEKLLDNQKLEKGDCVKIFGELRTYDRIDGAKKKLLIFAYVLTIEKITKEEFDQTKNKNCIRLKGNLCKAPVNRFTATKRVITDLLIATNRSFNRSDYIPCIAWGTNAYYAKLFKIGDLISLEGRLQSREKAGNTYYDLSINTLKRLTDEVNYNESNNN